jgi:hypothetical protein
VRKQIDRLLELDFIVMQGRRGTTGRSRPQFNVSPRLVRHIRDFLAWKDRKAEAKKAGKKVERFKANLRPAKPPKVDPTCSGRVDPTCSGRVDPTCSGRVDPLGVNNPSSSTGLNNRFDEPPGRPDERPVDAPSVPVGETNPDGGTIPLSPPSTSTHEGDLSLVDHETEIRAAVNRFIYLSCAGLARGQVELILLDRYGNDESNRQWAMEEFEKYFSKRA